MTLMLWFSVGQLPTIWKQNFQNCRLWHTGGSWQDVHHAQCAVSKPFWDPLEADIESQQAHDPLHWPLQSSEYLPEPTRSSFHKSLITSGSHSGVHEVKAWVAGPTAGSQFKPASVKKAGQDWGMDIPHWRSQPSFLPFLRHSEKGILRDQECLLPLSDNANDQMFSY